MRNLFLLYTLFSFTFTFTAEFHPEIRYIEELKQLFPITDDLLEELYMQANSIKKDSTHSLLLKDHGDIPLFHHYPNLRDSIAYLSFASLPTPIKYLEKLTDLYSSGNIYVKCDDLAGKILPDGTRLFGGNKIRKLEFILADAISCGARKVLTYGGFGSNHATCTATYARELGLEPILLLKSQPNAHVVQRNLLLMDSCGSQFYTFENSGTIGQLSGQAFLDSKKSSGDFPYVIPVGGSSSHGILGFVNAAFELKEQINAGLMPEPDVIYVALGTGGTAVGLQLGLRALGMQTKIIAVTTEPKDPNELVARLKSKFEKTNKFLLDHDSTFPQYSFDENAIEIRYEFCGEKYGLFTQEGIESQQQLEGIEGIVLDGTYTAKAFSCLMSDTKKNLHVGKTVLFWNTFCSDDFYEQLKDADYKKLPSVFHEYFENTVQPLDK